MACDSLSNFAVLLNRRFWRCKFPFCQRILLHHAGAVYCCLWEKRQVVIDPSHEPVHGSRTRLCAGGWLFWGPLKEKDKIYEESTFYCKKQRCGFDC